MLARALGYGLSGVSGFRVIVEVYAANGMPALEIIGLPDASVKESRDRVSAAIAKLEPALLCVMAGIAGYIVIAIYMSIFSMYSVM